MRNVNIIPALNGFIVNVGCQTVVFDSRAKLIAALGAYLENPTQVEQQFLEQAVNKLSLPPQPRDRVEQAPSGAPIGRTNLGSASH